MAIDYTSESQKYRPSKVTTLLIGEAPPPKRDSYFYLPTQLSNTQDIRNDRTLPATIFHHYFRKRPHDIKEYETLLNQLKEKGIFLVDIYEKPIRVRGSQEGLEKIIEEIPKLRGKLKKGKIDIVEDKMIFLLARNNYKAQIREEFSNAHFIRWIDFRMSTE